MSASALEGTLKLQLRALGLPPPIVELRFGATLGRQWRFDLAWPSKNLAVEIAGGTWMPQSHHTHGQGFEDDCEKQAAAVILGWRIITLTGKQVENGKGAAWIEQALRGGEIPAQMFAKRQRPSGIGLRGLTAKSDGRGSKTHDRGELPDRVRRAAGLP